MKDEAKKWAAVVSALILVAWLGRYEIVPASNQLGTSAYVLDRWTGEVEWVTGQARRPVTDRPAMVFDPSTATPDK